MQRACRKAAPQGSVGRPPRGKATDIVIIQPNGQYDNGKPRKKANFRFGRSVSVSVPVRFRFRSGSFRFRFRFRFDFGSGSKRPRRKKRAAAYGSFDFLLRFVFFLRPIPRFGFPGFGFPVMIRSTVSARGILSLNRQRIKSSSIGRNLRSRSKSRRCFCPVMSITVAGLPPIQSRTNFYAVHAHGRESGGPAWFSGNSTIF